MNFISQDWVSVVSLLFDVLGEVYFDHQTIFRIPQIRSSTSFTQCSHNTYCTCGLLGSWQSLRDPSSPQKGFPFLGTTIFSLQSGLFERSLSPLQELTWKGSHYFHNRKSRGGGGYLGDSLARFASSSERLPTKCSSSWLWARGEKVHLFFRYPRRWEEPFPEACDIVWHIVQVIPELITGKGNSICLTSIRLSWSCGTSQLL